MGYVAVKGGQDAIDNAAELVEYYRWRERSEPVEVRQFRTQYRLLIDWMLAGEPGGLIPLDFTDPSTRAAGQSPVGEEPAPAVPQSERQQ